VAAVHPLVDAGEYVLQEDVRRHPRDEATRNRRTPADVERLRPRTAAAVALHDLPQILEKAVARDAGAGRHERLELRREQWIRFARGIGDDRAIPAAAVAIDVALHDWRERQTGLQP